MARKSKLLKAIGKSTVAQKLLLDSVLEWWKPFIALGFRPGCNYCFEFPAEKAYVFPKGKEMIIEFDEIGVRIVEIEGFNPDDGYSADIVAYSELNFEALFWVAEKLSKEPERKIKKFLSSEEGSYEYAMILSPHQK